MGGFAQYRARNLQKNEKAVAAKRKEIRAYGTTYQDALECRTHVMVRPDRLRPDSGRQEPDGGELPSYRFIPIPPIF